MKIYQPTLHTKQELRKLAKKRYLRKLELLRHPPIKREPKPFPRPVITNAIMTLQLED
jgi:hypothetical protein